MSSRWTESLNAKHPKGVLIYTRHSYKAQPLRALAEISADISAIEKEAEGLRDGLLVEATQP